MCFRKVIWEPGEQGHSLYGKGTNRAVRQTVVEQDVYIGAEYV